MDKYSNIIKGFSDIYPHHRKDSDLRIIKSNQFDGRLMPEVAPAPE